MAREIADLDPKIGQGREIGDLDCNADQDYALQLPPSLFPHRIMIRRWLDDVFADIGVLNDWTEKTWDLWFIRASPKVPIGVIAVLIDTTLCKALIAGDATVEDYRKRLAIIAEEAGERGCVRFELIGSKMAAALQSDVWHLAGRA